VVPLPEDHRDTAHRDRYKVPLLKASIDSHHRNHDGCEGLLVPHASIQLFICVLLFRLTSVHYSDNDLQ